MEEYYQDKLFVAQKASELVLATRIPLVREVQRNDSSLNAVVLIGPSVKPIKLNGEVLKPHLKNYKRLL